MILNNGNFRRTTFVLRRFVNGVERTDGTFPVTENITGAFGNEPSLTLDQFTLLSDSEYLNRLSLFYDYLEFKYPFFKRQDYANLETEADGPHGTNVTQCPIDDSTPTGMFVNFNFEREEVSAGNWTGTLYLVLSDSDGQQVSTVGDTVVTVLLKENVGSGAVDWESIAGDLLTITVPAGNSEVLVLPRFRYEGVDLGDMDYKNIYARIIEVTNSQTATLIGPKNLVFTVPDSLMILTNLITNIGESYQDVPPDEILAHEVETNPGIPGDGDVVFEFSANVNMRPVLIYPSDMPDVSGIYSSEDLTYDLMSVGTFVRTVRTLTVNGESREYKIYSAVNQIIYPRRVYYNFYF